IADRWWEARRRTARREVSGTSRKIGGSSRTRPHRAGPPSTTQDVGSYFKDERLIPILELPAQPLERLWRIRPQGPANPSRQAVSDQGTKAPPERQFCR